MVFALLGYVENLNIHRAVFFAFFAADTFVRIQFDMEKGKTAGRLQKDGDRTDIFAESPVVFADKSQCNANNIVYKIAEEKTVPHNLFNVLDMKQKKAADKNQGTDKNNIADESPFSAGRCGVLKGSKSRIIAVQQA